MEKTQNNNDLERNIAFYFRFKSYRKYFKKLIKHAKTNLYCKKFSKVINEMLRKISKHLLSKMENLL